MLCDPVHQDEAATDTYISPSSWACHGQPGEFRGPEWFKIMNMFLLSFSHSHVNFDCCHATSLKVSRSGFRQEEGRMGSQHSLCWYIWRWFRSNTFTPVLNIIILIRLHPKRELVVVTIMVEEGSKTQEVPWVSLPPPSGCFPSWYVLVSCF